MFQCIDYLGHAVALSHQVIYQLIGQRTVLGLTHLKYTHIKNTQLNGHIILYICWDIQSDTRSSHRLNSHLHSQVVIGVGTFQEVLQRLRDGGQK